MFFPAFKSYAPFPESFILRIEYQASQALIGADRNFLKEAIGYKKPPNSKPTETKLSEALFWEIESFGCIPQHMRDEVLKYFKENHTSINTQAERLIENDGNLDVCRDITTPNIGHREVERKMKESSVP